jgi:hypothetical protein
MLEGVLNVAQRFILGRLFRTRLAGNQGGTSLPRRQLAGLLGGGAFQPQQVPAGGTKIPQTSQVPLQVALQTQAQLHGEVAGERRQTAAAAFQANHLVEILAEDAREFEREASVFHCSAAGSIGDRNS